MLLNIVVKLRNTRRRISREGYTYTHGKKMYMYAYTNGAADIHRYINSSVYGFARFAELVHIFCSMDAAKGCYSHDVVKLQNNL